MIKISWQALFLALALTSLPIGDTQHINKHNKNNSHSTTGYYRSHSSNLSNSDHFSIVRANQSSGQQFIDASVLPTTVNDDDDDETLNLLTKGYETHLERSSVIYGLTKVANQTTTSEICYHQLKHIRRGILRKEPWALKVLDASGTKPSGFVFGQNFWFGSREACGAVQRPVAITLSKHFDRVMHYGIITERAPFDVDYRVIYLRHKSPWQVEIKLMSEQIIHIGLCLPRSCASTEIEKLTADYVEGGLFAENDIYDMQPEVVYMKDLKLKESFYERSSFKLLWAFGGVTLIFVICASLLRTRQVETETEIEAEKETETKTEKEGETEFSLGSSISNILSPVRNFMKCYDIQENLEKMYVISETNNAGGIPVINGLRSIFAVWIMLFHVMWFMYFTVNNKTFLLLYAEKIFFQYISSAPLLVDAFFTISGFLQAYNFLKNSKQVEIVRQNGFYQNAKLFFKLLFHRYLRLAPLYIVTIACVDLFYAYIRDISVYHINEPFDQICSDYGWRNILFIQNFFSVNDMCLTWSWSLACEMQYFILATILLFTYTKHPTFVKAIVFGILVATNVWTYLVGFDTNFQLSFDTVFSLGTEIYINPLVRIMPYALGAMTAWYFIEKKGEFEISEMKERCFWNLSILIFFACIYSTIKRDMSVLSSVSLFVIGRLCFSLSVCWMIVGSATGRGCSWSRLLEAKIFQHTNRISYAYYLLNPFVIAIFFSLTSVSTHADPFMLCVTCAGFSLIIYIASVVFSLVFEVPYCNWSSLLLKKKKVLPTRPLNEQVKSSEELKSKCA